MKAMFGWLARASYGSGSGSGPGAFVRASEQDRSVFGRLLAVQQIYRGWAWFGVIVVAQLLSTLALAVTLALRRAPTDVSLPTLVAVLCIAAGQVLFWFFAYPANVATDNWTMLPEAWQQIRAQWEYSHAAGVALNLIAMVSLILSLLARE